MHVMDIIIVADKVITPQMNMMILRLFIESPLYSLAPHSEQNFSSSSTGELHFGHNFART